MLNQVKKQEKVFNQVFTAQNVLKAEQAYRHFTDKYLGELDEAMKSGDSFKATQLKKKLKDLSINLAELNKVEVPTFSFAEVIQLTAPVRREDVKQRLSTNKKVFTPKNIEQSLKLYNGYVDVYLDNLNTALKNGDLERVEEVKSELESLRVNISKLQREVNV